jgi:hypothetical protein
MAARIGKKSAVKRVAKKAAAAALTVMLCTSVVALTGCATPATPATACPAVQASCKGMTASCKGMSSCKGKSYKRKNMQTQ